jgi:hypothetical protein
MDARAADEGRGLAVSLQYTTSSYARAEGLAIIIETIIAESFIVGFVAISECL